MFTVLTQHRLLSSAFIILLLLSIICQMMVGVIYRRMIKETDNMSSTDNKFLKQCKLKFINCYQLNEGVANIPVFVDKFLATVSFKGISLNSLYHLSGQFMLLSVAAAGIGACLEIVQGATVAEVLPYYIAGFFGLYIYFSVSGMVDGQGKKERLKTNLVDYLENHMVNKLRQSAIDWEELTGESISSVREKMPQHDRMGSGEAGASEKIRAMREGLGLSPERVRADKKKAAEGTSENESEHSAAAEDRREGFSRHEEQELEELLREFFV